MFVQVLHQASFVYHHCLATGILEANISAHPFLRASSCPGHYWYVVEYSVVHVMNHASVGVHSCLRPSGVGLVISSSETIDMSFTESYIQLKYLSLVALNCAVLLHFVPEVPGWDSTCLIFKLSHNFHTKVTVLTFLWVQIYCIAC